MICEGLWTDNNKYEQDCNLYWVIPSMRPLEMLVYNISMVYNSQNTSALKPVLRSEDEFQMSYDR